MNNKGLKDDEIVMIDNIRVRKHWPGAEDMEIKCILGTSRMLAIQRGQMYQFKAMYLKSWMVDHELRRAQESSHAFTEWRSGSMP